MSKEYIIMIPFATYQAAIFAAEKSLLEYKIVCKEHPWFTKLDAVHAKSEEVAQ